jgi:hypothetical protein
MTAAEHEEKYFSVFWHTELGTEEETELAGELWDTKVRSPAFAGRTEGETE